MTALPAAELIDLHAPQDRDYATEMHDLLESEDQGDPAPLVAARVVAKIRVTDYPFTSEQWAMIWLTGEQQGIGASRSQGFGRYTVTRWDKAPQ